MIRGMYSPVKTKPVSKSPCCARINARTMQKLCLQAFKHESQTLGGTLPSMTRFENGVLTATEFVQHYRGAANNYLNLGDLEKAQKYITAAENKLTEINDSTEVVLTYSLLSKICEAQKNFTAATQYAEKALAATEPENINDLSHNYRRLGDLYWRIGKFADSIDCYEKAINFQREYEHTNLDFIEGAQVSIAITLKDMGRLDESDKLFQEILVQMAELYPDSHNKIRQVKKLLAEVRSKKNS